MTDPHKLTDDELFEALDEQAAADEAERILLLSDAQLDAELRAAGVDPREVERQGEQLRVKLARGPVARASLVRRLVWALPAGSLAVAASVGAILVATRGQQPLAIGPEPPGRPAASVPRPADTLAREGLDACTRGNWDLCLEKLDAAIALDPSLASDPEVQRAHVLAVDGAHADARPPDKPQRRR